MRERGWFVFGIRQHHVDSILYCLWGERASKNSIPHLLAFWFGRRFWFLLSGVECPRHLELYWQRSFLIVWVIPVVNMIMSDLIGINKAMVELVPIIKVFINYQDKGFPFIIGVCCGARNYWHISDWFIWVVIREDVSCAGCIFKTTSVCVGVCFIVGYNTRHHFINFPFPALCLSSPSRWQ